MKNFIAIVLLFLAGCSGKTSETKVTNNLDSNAASTQGIDSSAVNKSGFPYDLLHPADKYKMPKELTEISAIATYRKSKLVCVQDEQGKVFIYDLKKGEVKEGIDFGKKGDYEGVANVNDTIYVLSSNGNLHQIVNFDSKDRKTHEFKTPLDTKNDTEGLCYDAANRRLLIACKQDPGPNMKGMRAVYAFDLGTMILEPTPVYTISIPSINAYLAQNEKAKLITEHITDLFDPKKGDITFQPSEICIHPITKQIFLISTVGKLLIVLDPNGSISHIQSLDASEMKQPEGLCFESDGTMFISDEGRSGHGNILQFTYKP